MSWQLRLAIAGVGVLIGMVVCAASISVLIPR